MIGGSVKRMPSGDWKLGPPSGICHAAKAHGPALAKLVYRNRVYIEAKRRLIPPPRKKL